MIQLLEGVRVLECAVLFNGDQTGRLLGDLGADVIKIEAPPVGDYLRDFLGQIVPHHSPAHMYVNRNKRSITLNLREAEGKQVFFDLVRTADIFVDGFAGDACTRMGIGYEQQREIKPDIIYAQCSGFGASGPYAQVPTHGMMMGALGGGANLELRPDGLVDEQGGLTDGTTLGATYTALTALAALRRRDRTGEGAYIDGAGSDAVLSTNWFAGVYEWNDERLTDRSALPEGEGRNPKYHFYQTKDERFVLFCGIEPKFWRNFCVAAGREDLLKTHDDNVPVDFRSGGDALVHELADLFRTRTQTEWMDLAVAHDIPLGPANRSSDLLDDPQLKARNAVHESVHPVAGPFTAPSWPALVRGQSFDVARPAPTLGQHQEEILAEIGLDSDEVARLRERGIL